VDEESEAIPQRERHPVALVRVCNLFKEYRLGTTQVHALDGVCLEVEAGSFVSVMGPSGSGKSTLLHLIGGLDTPTDGVVEINGKDLSTLDDEELTLFRRRNLGFVFQFFNLLPTMSAWENVALPRLLDGLKLSEVRPRALELLEMVGLGNRADHKPSQLSGGEMQRVAVARALVADPILVLADEPTGNLDSRSGEAVLDLLRETVTNDGRTVIVVTHDSKASSVADRIVELKDGRLVS
jgi:putative ABC transport system ATP-binding protein